jgi:N,N-dimethylformamidase
MVYFPIEGGGAVFSVGSITFSGAMAWNDFDNAAARVATNVLRTFASPRSTPAEPKYSPVRDG